MIFSETPLKGAYIIDLQKYEDHRGFFARLFCVSEYDKYGLDKNVLQINNSFSKYKGTLRGMHYQLPPKAETKIIRCTRGSLFDVIIDLRQHSPTFGQHFGTELTEENRKMMYVPKYFAHGFITLEDNTEALYMVTELYSPNFERCIRWNDSKFNIQWPLQPTVLSDKDRKQFDFDVKYHLNV